MPCHDGRDAYRTVFEYRDAQLCAILTVLERKGILKEVITADDWREAGVSSAGLFAWWKEHQKADCALICLSETQVEELNAAKEHGFREIFNFFNPNSGNENYLLVRVLYDSKNDYEKDNPGEEDDD